MNYNDTYFQKKVDVSQPKPGREKEMKKNLAGGHGFKADDFTALRRWLLTGSMDNAYYQNSSEMTTGNLDTLVKCVDADPKRTAQEITYASNKGMNNHTPLLALVYLSNGGFDAKKEFRAIFNLIVRTASHLYEFMSYVKSVRGMGKVIHKAVADWIESKELKEAEYQFLKYQQRNGWSGRDVLRLVKPVPKTEGRDTLYAWIAGNEEKANVKALTESSLMRIEAYERLKMGVDEAEAIHIIEEFNMTHEMIPANIERTSKVWDALFQRMPLTASLRSLGSLTSKGILTKDNLNLLEERFEKESLRKARLHPLTIANGYYTYMQGHGMKGSLEWNPINRVNDILDKAINDAFEVIEPTGKSFFHALDISGSMNWNYYGIGRGRGVGNLSLDPMQVAGLMALATVKAEKDYFVGGFSHYFVELPELNKRASYDSIMKGEHVKGLNFGGTNASLAYKYATEHKVPVDVFVSWTDGEDWLGDHPTDALAEYRSKVNPDAKAVYVTISAYSDNVSLVDPKDPNSYDIVGFSTETPKLIQLIAEGAI